MKCFGWIEGLGEQTVYIKYGTPRICWKVRQNDAGKQTPSFFLGANQRKDKHCVQLISGWGCLMSTIMDTSQILQKLQYMLHINWSMIHFGFFFFRARAIFSQKRKKKKKKKSKKKNWPFIYHLDLTGHQPSLLFCLKSLKRWNISAI